MFAVWSIVWVHVSLSLLGGEVSVTIDDRDTEITLATELPPGAPNFLVSYLMALRDPYRSGDIDRLWDYPQRPEGSAAQWVSVEVDGVPVPLGEEARVPLPPGKNLRARIRARIPERYGGLGRVDGDVLLTAAVPFVTTGDRAQRVSWRVKLSELQRGQWLQKLDAYEGDPSLFLLAAARRGYVTLDGEKQSPIVRPMSRPGAPPRYGYFSASADEKLIEAHRWIEKALAADGVPAQKWVTHALRREPVVCAENALVVSRELFRATPLPQIMSFQRFGLARRAIACALRTAWKISAEDADALAAARVDQLFREENTTLTNPRDLLRPLAFIPDIDSLIYAPQMPWADVYFMAMDEPRVGPPQPDEFFHPRARGKLLFEKLWDRIGAERTKAFVAEAMSRHVGLSTIANERVPEVWVSIVHAFGEKHPVYDASFRTEEKSIIVEKDGEGALSGEPVGVVAYDRSGKKFELRAENFEAKDPEHAEARLHVDDALLPFSSIEIDPERRLVEYKLKPGEHPRYNNSTGHRVRVTLARLSAAYGSSASEVVAGIDFNIRREYDLHHHFGFGADYDPLGAGVNARYSFAFGPRITPDYLAYRVGTTVSVERLTEGFVGATEPVYLTTIYAYLHHDDRPSDRTAMRGFGWQIYGAIGVPIYPLGRIPFGYAGASVLKILPLADGHGLAGRLRVGTVIGDAPRQALFALGGRANARGFPQTERTAAVRITANLEYRHVLMRGFRASLFDLVHIDGVEGAFFGDAVLLADDWRQLFSWQNAFFDVGYGIRFLFDQLGVNPGMMAIDLGVPLKRFDSSRPPVSIFFDFVQSFAGL